MNIRRRVMFLVIGFLVFSTVMIDNEENRVHAFSAQVIQRGATGDDVIELQARLQYNGYYHGTIDGVFGWSTYWAVRNFQEAFGLENVDGLVGEKTKEMLARATKYNKTFVFDNLNKGNRFTHYGDVPWKIQSAPSKKTIEQAKQKAEARKTKIEAQYKTGQQPQNEQQKPGTNKVEQKPKQQAQQPPKQQQGQQAQQPKQQQPKQQAQQPTQQPKQQAQQPKQQQPKQQTKQQPKAAPKKQAKVQQAPKEPKKQGTAAVNMPGGFSQNDIQLLANAVYGEARGEPYIGQVAIAAVILNRINSPTFPDSVSGVIFEPLAFTAVADGQIWLTPNEQAKKAVIDAINGFDPTDGATYYFNPATATSKWIWGRPQIKRIGKHIFCR